MEIVIGSDLVIVEGEEGEGRVGLLDLELEESKKEGEGEG